jgi:hypothetical protein
MNSIVRVKIDATVEERRGELVMESVSKLGAWGTRRVARQSAA